MGWCDVAADCTNAKDALQGYSGWDYCDGLAPVEFEANATVGAGKVSWEEEIEAQDWRLQATVLVLLAGYVWYLKDQVDDEEDEAAQDELPTQIPSKMSDAKLIAEITELELRPSGAMDTPRPTSADVATAAAVRAQGLNSAALDALIALYATYCPSKVSQAAELLSKYSGREDQLLRLVEAKYCPSSADFDPTLPTPR